jgi:hypothetical protein
MNTPPKQGIRATQRNALQRIETLENDLQSVVGAIQKALQSIDGKINTHAEILDALANEVGPESINAAIAAGRVTRATEHAAASKAALEKALADGELAVAETVTESSVIVGVEYDKNGEAVPPGYVQLGMNTVKPEFQEKMLGQKAGFKFDTADGSFEVTGVYTVLDTSPPQPTERSEP